MGKCRTNWDEVPLGTVPDSRIAEAVGVSVVAVAAQRIRRGIVAYQPHKGYQRRNKTLSATRISRADFDKIRSAIYPDGIERPKCRADCVNAERPCPWVSCRHHLYVDVSRVGALVLNWPEKEPWEIKETCVLDLADRGGMTLEEVGAIMNLTRERVRQIEQDFLTKLLGDDDVQRLGREYDLPKVA